MSSSNILRLLRDALALNGERLDLASGDIISIRPGADDTGSVNIGDGTYDMDVKTFLGASTKYVLMDVGNSRLQLEDVDQLFGDTDKLIFGDGSDVTLQWDGTRLVGSSVANAMWDNCPSPLDPNYKSTCFEFFDDFMEYDGTATVGNWLCAQAGGAGATTALITDVAGGKIEILCADTDDNCGNQISQVSAPFYLAAGKHLWFEIRFRINNETNTDVTQSDYYFGLASLSENLTEVSDNLPADGVVFHKDDGDAGTLQCTASLGGVNTSTNADVATLVDGTWVTAGFYVNGVTSITPYINGVAQTALPTTTIPDDTAQGVIMGARNGDDTATQNLEVDYVRVVQLR